MPPPLLEPCTVEARAYATLADVGLILTDHVQALGCANEKIADIGAILSAAQAEAGPL